MVQSGRQENRVREKDSQPDRVETYGMALNHIQFYQYPES
jgi:hypothetical protein